MTQNGVSQKSIFIPSFKYIELDWSQDQSMSERLEILKNHIRKIPDVTGVYYFLGENGAALYIGKSIHIRRRLMEHFASFQSPSIDESDRKNRILLQTRKIGWRESVGEAHALLLENREIKKQLPFHNKAQRRIKRLYTWQFDQQRSARLVLTSFVQLGAQVSNKVSYGLYRNSKAAQDAIIKMADEEQICLRMIGFEKGSGACFRSQINKCAGACAGREPVDDMMSRLLDALLPLAFESWPYTKPVQLEENGAWHVFHHWQSFGVFSEKLSETELKNITLSGATDFDNDEYRIIRRLLHNNTQSIFEGEV